MPSWRARLSRLEVDRRFSISCVRLVLVPVVSKFYGVFFGRCPFCGSKYTQHVGEWPFLRVKESMKAQISLVADNFEVEGSCGFGTRVFLYRKLYDGRAAAPNALPHFSSMDVNILHDVHSD